MATVWLTGEQLFGLVADEDEIEAVYDDVDERALMAQVRAVLDLDDQLGLFDDDSPVTGTDAL